jgi:bis(5'-nucleosidyl)-tetraphosphatase
MDQNQQIQSPAATPLKKKPYFRKDVFGALKKRSSDKQEPDEPRRTSRTSKSVGAIVLNQKLQVLLIFQQQNQYWEFPKGKMEAGEDEVATLKREINEETGIRKFRLVHNFRKLMYYTFRFEGKMIRRSVVYYLIQTTDKIQLSDEHSQYMWLSFDAAKQRLKHKNQVKLLDEVLQLIYG